MKIISLTAENIKRIKAVSLKPDGKSVVIGGDNGQGKSSVLDSILFAIGGKDVICDKPIRKGEKRGEIVIELNDLTVTRRFTEGGTSLVVKNKNGEAQVSPQMLLDKLTGDLSFDPLEFSRMDAKAQRDTLARLAGLDLDAITAEYQKAFNERTEANRLPAAIKANLAGKAIQPGLPEEEVSADDLLKKLEEIQAHNFKCTQAQTEAERLGRALSAANLAREDEAVAATSLQQQLKAVQKALEVKTQQATQVEAAYEEQLRKAAAAVKQDEAPVKSELSNLTAKNTAIRQNKFITEKQRDLKKAEEKAAALTKQLEKILDRKEKMVNEAKYPLEGLAADEGEVYYNKIPLKQASDAEQIRISTAIGMALNPQLRVMLIKSGCFLDSKSLAELHKLAAENDVQLWIERVGDGKEVSVVIEDGSVIENRMEREETPELVQAGEKEVA
jgi:recombinational DNA repair ATPase RecF